MGMAKPEVKLDKPLDGKHVDAPAIPVTAIKPQVTDWNAKDRSQLVGGRSHDAVSLVNTALVTGTPLAAVVKLYREALEAVLAISAEVK